MVMNADDRATDLIREYREVLDHSAAQLLAHETLGEAALHTIAG